MNVMMVLRDPAVLAGEERSMTLESNALRARGHQVHLMHGVSEIENGSADGDICLPELFDLAPFVERSSVRQRLKALLSYVERHSIDVIHLHATLRYAVARRLVVRVPIVSTAHVVSCPNHTRYLWTERRACDRKIGLGCLTTGYRTLGCGHLGNGAPLGLPGFARGMVMDHRVRAQYARSHRTIAPSQWMARFLEATGMPANRIRVLEPPLPEQAPIGKWPDGIPILTFVGRLVDFKGADQLIEASAQLDVDHRVAIVGSGPALEHLRRVAQDCGVTDRVDFYGALPPAEVDRLRRRSSAVVVPSLMPETYGMVGSEALALGVPVVGFGVGGTAECLALGGRLAATVAPLDVAALARELRKIVTQPPTDAERRAAAQAVRSALASARHGERLLRIYGEAIDTACAEGFGGGCAEPTDHHNP
jgi:glycosyltransferase involved in cell wall biosynthesis